MLVKASEPGDHDRTYVTRGGVSERVPVHPVHDLPHLVVESLFGIDDGLWAELARGAHREATAAVTARDPKRQKLGRIVSGPAGRGSDSWLSEGHRLAKAATNAVTNRWGDGPDTASGVRRRLSMAAGEEGRILLERLDDETIALAIRGVGDLQRRWAATSPGSSVRLEWPLPGAFFARGEPTV